MVLALIRGSISLKVVGIAFFAGNDTVLHLPLARNSQDVADRRRKKPIYTP